MALPTGLVGTTTPEHVVVSRAIFSNPDVDEAHTVIIAVLDPVPVAVRRVRRALRSPRWRTHTGPPSPYARQGQTVTVTRRRPGMLLAHVAAGIGLLAFHAVAEAADPVYDAGGPSGHARDADEVDVHVKPVGSMSEIVVSGPDAPVTRRVVRRLRDRLRG